MATVTYGAYITELKGSIGGVTFQRNYSDKIARLKPYVHNSKSSYQLTRQRNMAYLAYHWTTLSGANQATWAALALAHNHTNHWGEVKKITGYQWYMALNMNMLLQTNWINDSAPTWVTYAPFPAYTIEATVDYLRLVMSDVYTQSGITLRGFITPIIKDTSVNIRKNWLYSGANVIEASYYIYLTDSLCNKFGYTWADLWNYAKGHVTFHLMVLGGINGFSNPFVSGTYKFD